ncbi:MAG: ATP-binding protein [Bryobacteraceae bacterium]
MPNTVFGVAVDHEIGVQLEQLGIRIQPVEGDLFQVAADNPDAVILAGRPNASLDDTLALHDGLKAILLAGDTSDVTIPDAMRKHWFAYFSRPFDLDEIVATIQEAQAIQSWSDGIEVVSARPNWLTLQVRCRRYTAERLVRFMREIVADLPAAERERVGMAFREIVLNGMEHGAAFDGAKHLCVSCIRTSRFVMYSVRDPGAGFDFNRLPHAAISNPADNPAQHMLYRAQQGIRAGGFGLMVARDLVDEMLHNEAGNEVVLIKYLDSAGAETVDAKGFGDAA